MESEQDELSEDQALLIRYLSGELAEDQHAAMEVRLEIEEPLRLELENLRCAQAMIWREMLAADSAQPPRGAASIAHRKLASMVRQWAVQQLAKPPVTVSSGHALRRWGVALALAAAILIGLGIYLYGPEGQGEPMVAESSGVSQQVDQAQVDSSVDDSPMNDVLVSAGLNDVEEQLDALVQLRTLTQ